MSSKEEHAATLSTEHARAAKQDYILKGGLKLIPGVPQSQLIHIQAYVRIGALGSLLRERRCRIKPKKNILFVVMVCQ